MSVELEAYDALTTARKLEIEYNWDGAARLYKEILDSSRDDPSRVAELNDLRGYALYRSAMQAQTPDEFQARTNESRACYANVKQLLGKNRTRAEAARTDRARAWITYLEFWTTPKQLEKRRMLDRAWNFARNALDGFKESGNYQLYAKTYNDFAPIAGLRFFFERGARARDMLRESFELGEEAVRLSTSEVGQRELARIYVSISATSLMLADGLDPKCRTEIERLVEASKQYWLKAKEQSLETAHLEIAYNQAGSWLPFLIDKTIEGQINLCGRAIEEARATRDRCAIGRGFDVLAHLSMLKSQLVEDPIEAKKLCHQGLQYARDAKEQFSPLSYTSPRGGVMWIESPLTEYHQVMSQFETDVREKQGELQEASREASELLEKARLSENPDILRDSHHVISKTLLCLSRTLTETSRKRKVLEESLLHRLESIRIAKLLESYPGDGQQYLDFSYLSDLKLELSCISPSSLMQKKLLLEAARDKAKSLKLQRSLTDTVAGEVDLDFFRRILARTQTEYGDLLYRLFTLDRRKKDLRGAAVTYEEASSILESLALPSRAAECSWKASKAYDDLGEYEKATGDFLIASKNYAAAATKVPGLEKFYQDYSIYMQAWSEIEQARTHHSVEKYPEATGHYQAASHLFEKTTQWKYLAPSYAALYHMENGEDLSRRDLLEDAALQFETAGRLFQEACLQVQTSFGDSNSAEERRIVAEVTKIAKLRAEYSKARKYMEEGTILGRKGDNRASAERYKLAVEALQRISEPRVAENLQVNVRYGLSLAKASHIEAQAETAGSYDLYQKASSLFEQASHIFPTER